MPDSACAGHFYPTHAYVAIMLTPIRSAHLTRGRNAHHLRQHDTECVRIYIPLGALLKLLLSVGARARRVPPGPKLALVEVSALPLRS